MSTVVLMHGDMKLAHRLREEISQAPDLEVTGVADSLPALREVFKQGLPDLVIVDLMLPPTHLKSLLQSLRSQGSFGKPLILALAVSVDDPRLIDALCHGADGYYADARPTVPLIAAIQQLLRGESSMSPQIARHVRKHFAKAEWVASDFAGSNRNPMQLTETDRLLLQWTAEGYLPNEVARGLQLTAQAVGARMRNIYRKLQFDVRSANFSFAAG
ncbi:LuxR C-terminal-related transcriptional regulator [Piscinibacter terrae]|uniref:DNA-binding response regulator n=1 Tax=Piscinibacter terrae TaxID=2496871 RepID=A0A3N7HNW7_9BURK|nr:response regulator transcription factor [Albitalea terrae]RQP22401.1 DNA-binding response regulator [Albitalea terrae]